MKFYFLYLGVILFVMCTFQDLDDTGLLKGFQGLVEKPSVAENVVSLLNKVLDNKYSTSKGIQVQELLTWNFWPDIIKIFGENLKYDTGQTCCLNNIFIGSVIYLAIKVDL